MKRWGLPPHPMSRQARGADQVPQCMLQVLINTGGLLAPSSTSQAPPESLGPRFKGVATRRSQCPQQQGPVPSCQSTTVALSSSVCPEDQAARRRRLPSQDHMAERSKPPPPRAPSPPRQGLRALLTPRPVPRVLLLGLGNRPVLGEKSR